MRFTYEGVFISRKDGGFDAEFPDIAGCSTFGDDLDDAIESAADVLESFLALALSEGVELPHPTLHHPLPLEKKGFCVLVSVEVDPDSAVPVRTTAEAAEMLGVSTGRIRQMIRTGILERRKEGRDNLVTLASIEERLDSPRAAGRPRKGTGD